MEAAQMIPDAIRARIPEWARRPLRLLRDSAERQDWAHERRRRRLGEPQLPSGAIRRVMVICHGNICRSPFAGRELARRCPEIEVRSAGLEAGEGHAPEAHALRVAAALGVDLAGHASHRLDEADVAWADLILAMQGRHLETLGRRWPEAPAFSRLLGDFLPGPPHAIEDPWGRDLETFRSVFERIVRANARLARQLAARAEGGAASSGPGSPHGDR